MLTFRRFLLRSELKGLLDPEFFDRWPLLIPIDDGPEVIDRPQGWRLPEGKYVRLQGRDVNGNHEWLHIPVNRTQEVYLYELPVSEVRNRPLPRGE